VPLFDPNINIDYEGSDYFDNLPNWGTDWSIGGSAPSSQSSVQPGDVIEVIGWGAGLVTQIIGSFASAKHQQTNEEIAVVIPPPPPATTDYTPYILGSVALLLVVMFGMRK
jgi:hypothetical protein